MTKHEALEAKPDFSENDAGLVKICIMADDAAAELVKLENEEITPATYFKVHKKVDFAKNVTNIIENPSIENIEQLAENHASLAFAQITKDSQRQGDSTHGLMTRLAYMTTYEAFLVDRFRVNKYTTGNISATRAFSERFITNMAMHTANYLYGRPDRKDILGELARLSTLTLDQPAPGTEWAAFKVSEYYQEVGEAFSVLELLMEQSADDNAETAELREAGDNLWQEAAVLRRFSLKPAIAPTNLPGLTNIYMRPGFEVVEELEEVSARINPVKTAQADPEPCKYTLDDAVAVTMLSDLPFSRKPAEYKLLQGSEEDRSFGAYVPFSKILDTTQEDLNGVSINHIMAIFQLRDDGELYTLHGVPIRDWAKQLGAEVAYQQVRLEQLALYYDLVVPVYVTKLIKDGLARQPVPATPTDRLHEMTIARTKYLRQNQQTVVSELEKEESEASYEYTGEKRPVVGHPRSVPSDFSADIQTRERALREGRYVLADFGETWVRYHQRGTRGRADTVYAKPVRGKYKERQRVRK